MKQTKRMVGWLVAGTAALSLGLVPLAAADPGTLSENESAELSFMREEERLARDLYQAFADKYDGARPFSMIVKAEQKHHERTPRPGCRPVTTRSTPSMSSTRPGTPRAARRSSRPIRWVSTWRPVTSPT